MPLPLPLSTAASCQLQRTPPQFGVELHDTHLAVPELLYAALKRLPAHNAMQFVNYLQAFPAAVAHELDWSLEEVLEAKSHLLQQLEGVLPVGLLRPEPPVLHACGALKPLEHPLSERSCVHP